MSEHTVKEAQKQIKSYLVVFFALAFLTLVTVLVSYLNLSIGKAVAVAMLIASAKASLVAAVFMHLSKEKKIIIAVMALTIIFFVALMLLPTITQSGL